MNKTKLKKRNINLILFGSFFIVLSEILVAFFLPFYLKEGGLNILEIGALLTFGMAIGHFVITYGFSKLQKRLKLKSTLLLSAGVSFLLPFALFVFPNVMGVILSTLFLRIKRIVSGVSRDVAFQHNTTKKNKRKVTSYELLFYNVAAVVGLIVSVLLISKIGWIYSFLIFAIFSLPAFLLFGKVKEETRFKLKPNVKLPKISSKLKLILFSEVIYWFGLSASFALVMTFLVIDKFQGSLWWISIMFIGLYASMWATTMLTKKYLDNINLLTSSIIGMFILLLSAIVVIVSQSLYVVLFAMVLEGVGAGIWTPSKKALYWHLTKPQLRETVSGYLFGAQGFVKILGPLAGGFLVAYLGILSPFYLKAIIAIASLMIYVYVFKK